MKATLPPRPQTLIWLLTRYTLMLGAVGTFIGLFHERDGLVALVLAVGLLLMVYRKRRLPPAERRVFHIGIILSGCLGSVCEYWGTYNHYWQYHDLDGGRNFPVWLPFAWAGAFAFLHTVERAIIRLREVERFSSKFMLTAMLSAVFPTIGEIITIQLGVWTYSWGYQFFGVPALAILLLILFHTGMFFILHVLRLYSSGKIQIDGPKEFN